VPVAARQLAARPARTAAGAVAIGLALMLMLVLDGLWAGVRASTTLLEDHSGAQLVVVSPGTSTLFGQPSTLSAATAARVRSTPGVAWASPVRLGYAIVDLHGRRAAVAIVGADPGAPGSPWEISFGRVPRTGAETAVDATFARQHALRLGDTLDVAGTDLRLVGLTGDSAMFMTPMVFTTQHAANSMIGSAGTTGAILVGTSRADAVWHRLTGAGLTVRSIASERSAALALATRIFGGPLRLMVVVVFFAGALTVALVAHTHLFEQRRDLAVLAALGAGRGRLAAVAAEQTAALTAAGALAGAGLVVAARVVVAAWRPQFTVLVTTGSIARTAVAAAVMAAVAVVMALASLRRLDPASAFRSAT
jgi:putative ABC transport system permease protein